MKIDIAVESSVSQSSRVNQLEAMFDVPPAEKSRLEWHGEIPLEEKPWNVGLIVGPSGCGKTTIARQLFAENFDAPLEWSGRSVIDDFAARLSMEKISQVCQAVGFNTIPAWMRPFAVLSNGERFRVELARRLIELPDPVVVDEFTSVVDRQVAQIGAHAVQKYVRRNKRKFVAVSCHYDIVDWLQPDWIFEPATMTHSWRLLQRRPTLDVTICRVPRSTWKLFAPFHYLTAELHHAATCFGLFIGQRIAAFAGILPRPVSRGAARGTALAGLTRVVTLPDWQGLGLAFVLMEKLGAAYAALGRGLHAYPAHPSFARHFDQNRWERIKEGGVYSSRSTGGYGGGRPCAVLRYVGTALDREEALALLGK